MYPRTCPKCGKTFTTTNYRQKKCRPACGRDRSNDSRTSAEKHRVRDDKTALEFIAVDGEAINVMGYEETLNDLGEVVRTPVKEHRYVILTVGEDALYQGGRELHYTEIFDFLWSKFLENPKAVFVGFFLGYDFSQWFKTLPSHTGWELFHKDGIAARKPREDSGLVMPWPARDSRPVYGEDGQVQRWITPKWELDILGMKRLKLRPFIPRDKVPTRIVTHKDGTQTEEKIPRPWMYICDTGAFFQSAFLKVIDPKEWTEPVCSAEEFELIKQGKDTRDHVWNSLNEFRREGEDDMLRYNALENRVLTRVMERMHAGFLSEGIALARNSWYGPGAAAQQWMRLIGVPSGEDVREAVPDWARDAARRTYFGGWFEIMRLGKVPGTTYEYDVNSAYPAVIAKLPCLLHGTWKRGDGHPRHRRPTTALRMLHATVQSPRDAPIGAMLHRNPDDSILRPYRTKGWYWLHELEAAKRAGCVAKWVTHEWVEYTPCDCPPPMRSIADLYAGRLAVGKNSPEGKSKKLVYNSSYGKLAQSIGMPRYSNPVWASLITAGCRTMILDAIATHPGGAVAVVMVATDGVYFTSPHPTLDIHPTRLGAWDSTELENVTLFMPGIYWSDATRAAIAAGNTPKLKSRGVSAKLLAARLDEIDRQFDRGDVPVVKIKVPWGVISPKEAASRDKWEQCGQSVYGAERVVDAHSNASKRGMYMGALFPYDESETGIESKPYGRTFGERAIDPTDELLTPDGTVGDLMAFELRK